MPNTFARWLRRRRRGLKRKRFERLGDFAVICVDLVHIAKIEHLDQSRDLKRDLGVLNRDLVPEVSGGEDVRPRARLLRAIELATYR